MSYVIQKDLTNTNSPEGRAVLQAALLRDDKVRIVGYHQLDGLDNDSRHSIPVGSVKYVEAFARHFGITMPSPIDYPSELNPFLHRKIHRILFSEAIIGDFIKPTKTKSFDTIRCFAAEEHGIDPMEVCWTSEPVNFMDEYRVYVLRGNVIGVCRYDSEPSIRDISLYFDNETKRMIKAYTRQPIAWALDVGFTANGNLLLVEVNDAWATGYYHEGLTPGAYTNWLTARWEEILEG